MENQAIKVEVNATMVRYQDLSKGCLSDVVISLSRQVEEFLLEESDGSVSSLGSYPSSLPDQLISLELQNFRQNYVFQHLLNHLHDPRLSGLVSDEILVQAQGRDLSQRSLFMIIAVKLTQKEYLVVPSSVSTATVVSDQETCAICLEDMSEWKTNPICQLPNCAHLFHEHCLNKWLDGQQNSCPLCRQSVDFLA